MLRGRVKVSRHWIIGIVVVSVALRIVASVYLGDRVVDLPGTFDQVSYDMLARQVVAGHGFTVAEDWWPLTKAGEPTAHWSYLYTLYLVAVYGVVGYHPLVARLLQAVIAGIAMPWLTYRLGNRHFGRRVGLASAGIMAVYVYFVYYAASLMTETFYIIAILWSFDLADKLGGVPSTKTGVMLNWFWLGLALGIAVLLRQLFLLFVPFLYLWLLWRAWHGRSGTLARTLGGLVISTTIIVAMIAPWTARNYCVFHRFVLLNTNAGFAFFWGNHPIHGYNFISILPPDGPSYQDLIPRELRGLDEAALDQALLKRALVIIQVDPLRYIILSVSRIKDYFKFWPSPQSGLISNLSRVLSFGLLWPFMVDGLYLSARRSDWLEHGLLYIFIVVYTGIHLLSWALIRYRLPVDAVLIIFAALALTQIFDWGIRRFR